MRGMSLILCVRQCMIRWRFAILAFVLGLFFVLWGLCQLPAYGASWDEPLHAAWGRLYLLYRSVGSREYLEMMPGNGIYYSPIFYVFSVLLSGVFLPMGWPLYQAAHVANLLAAACGLAATFGIGCALSGRVRTGMFAALFLVGFPQFLAHAHYNPKDIPLLAAVAVSMYVMLQAYQRNNRSRLILSAALFGVSFALKINAMLVLPAVILSYVSWLRQRWVATSWTWHDMFREQFFLIPLLITAFVLGVVLAWPSAWGDLMLLPRSIRFFLTESFWPGTELYFGTLYTGPDLPWHYIPGTLFLSTPVVMVLMVCVGVGHVLRSLGRPLAVMLLMWLGIPLVVSMMPGLVRYDGIRQFFFVVPAMAVMAAMGLDAVLHAAQRRFSRAWIASSILLLIVVLSLVHETWILHPFQGAYRNELARTLYPQDMDRVFPLEYWGASYAQGFAWLHEHARSNAEVCIPIAGALARWYDLRPDLSIECSSLTQYVMFFTRYDREKQKAYEHLIPVFTIQRMGASLLKIYDVRALNGEALHLNV